VRGDVQCALVTSYSLGVELPLLQRFKALRDAKLALFVGHMDREEQRQQLQQPPEDPSRHYHNSLDADNRSVLVDLADLVQEMAAGGGQQHASSLLQRGRRYRVLPPRVLPPGDSLPAPNSCMHSKVRRGLSSGCVGQ